MISRWLVPALLASVLITGCSASASPTPQSEPTQISLPLVESAGSTAPTVAETPTLQKTSPTEVSTPQISATQAPTAAIPCSRPAALTPPLTEGPYFMSGSPERTSLLEANTPGTRLILTGYVLTADCQPVVNALLEFWQADANGVYDNTGYTLRGHQFTDESGKYYLETVIPGIYTGRTEHIHVKVQASQAPNGPVLTTQLFFPDVAENQSDRIFDPSLVLPLVPVGDGQAAEFNFIIALQ